jgi:hypothetical protein
VSETAVRRVEKAGRINARRTARGILRRSKLPGRTTPIRRSSGRALGNEATGPGEPPEAGARSGGRGGAGHPWREHGEPVSAGGMTFMRARTANEELKALERRLRLQQMKGELADRAKRWPKCSGSPARSAMAGPGGGRDGGRAFRLMRRCRGGSS